MGFFEKWECRTRLIAALAWVTGVLLIHNLYILTALMALLTGFLALDRSVSFVAFKHKLEHLTPFLLLMAVTLIISDGFPITREAFLFTSLICLRILVSFLVITALTGKQETEAFITGLASIGIPSSYVTIMFLSNRYIKLLVQDLHQQMKALKARGFSAKVTRNTPRIFGYMVGGMFIRAYNRSEQVYQSMKARGFCGVIVYERATKIRGCDICKLAASILIILAAIGADVCLQLK